MQCQLRGRIIQSIQGVKTCSPQKILVDDAATATGGTLDPSIDAAKPPTSIGNVFTSSIHGGGGGNNRKVSPMWVHFTKSPCQNKKDQKAKCNYCTQELACPPANGTSSLRNHLNRCKEYPFNVDKKQKTLSFQPREGVSVSDGGSVHTTLNAWSFDKEKSRRALAKMIVVAELPFKLVDHEGFKDFCSEIQPRFVVPSRFTVARDCYNLFLEEKKKLKKLFSKVERVSITTDTWTSIQNFSYMCLTAHFIDDWKLHTKILNFCPIPGHSGEVIGKAIESCLLNWGISRVLTVTIDNASSNDVGIAYLRRRLNNWEGAVLKGELLHMRCAAHILNLVVKDGLAEVGDSIYRIRSTIKYVRSSPSRLQKFKTCAEKERIECNSLVCLDVETDRTQIRETSSLVFKLKEKQLQSVCGHSRGPGSPQNHYKIQPPHSLSPLPIYPLSSHAHSPHVVVTWLQLKIPILPLFPLVTHD